MTEMSWINESDVEIELTLKLFGIFVLNRRKKVEKRDYVHVIILTDFGKLFWIFDENYLKFFMNCLI